MYPCFRTEPRPDSPQGLQAAVKTFQGLTKTLYCRTAQEVSTQVQLLEASTDFENGEENLPPGICEWDPAGPEGGREGQERCELCVQGLRCTAQHDTVSARLQWAMLSPGLTSLFVPLLLPPWARCPPQCGSALYSYTKVFILWIHFCLCLGVP